VTPPVALSIAGADPSGGAGIQADLKTFAAHRVYGTAVVTALTAQSTRGVSGVFAVPVEFVGAQLAEVVADLPPSAVKVGMLGTAEAAGLVAEQAAAGALPNLVLDPVLTASSGYPLTGKGAVELLLPFATVVTPNLAEAAALAGFPVRTPEDMARAAGAIGAHGPGAVVVTGGDATGESTVDVLWSAEGTRLLRAPRVGTRNTHGTGCTFAAAIAARLARGEPVSQAVPAAKEYVSRALAGAAGWRLGGGAGPLDHFAGLDG
jgi:hydroxymethylpyrimidine/phosphomethylpyrimidine kinase